MDAVVELDVVSLKHHFVTNDAQMFLITQRSNKDGGEYIPIRKIGDCISALFNLWASSCCCIVTFNAWEL